MWTKRISNARIWRTSLEWMTMPRRLPHSFEIKRWQERVTITSWNTLHSWPMQFPLKAKSPSTFDLDYWRLSISHEFVHDCKNDMESSSCNPCWKKPISWHEIPPVRAKQGGMFQRDERHQTWKVNVKEIPTNIEGKNHNMSEFSPSNWKGQQKAGP